MRTRIHSVHDGSTWIQSVHAHQSATELLNSERQENSSLSYDNWRENREVRVQSNFGKCACGNHCMMGCCTGQIDNQRLFNKCFCIILQDFLRQSIKRCSAPSIENLMAKCLAPIVPRDHITCARRMKHDRLDCVCNVAVHLLDPSRPLQHEGDILNIHLRTGRAPTTNRRMWGGRGLRCADCY